MKIIFIFFLFVGACTAALSLDALYFPKAVEEISALLKVGADASDQLNLLNADSSYFILFFDSEFDKGMIKNYMEVIGKVSKMLYGSPSIDYKKSEVILFVDNLIKSIQLFEEYLNPNKMNNLINILLASATKANDTEIRSILILFIPKMTESQKIHLLNAYKKHVNTETCLIVKNIFQNDFLRFNQVGTFLDEYVKLLFDLLRSNPTLALNSFNSIYFTFFCCTSGKNIQLLDETFVLLLDGLYGFKVIEESKYIDYILKLLIEIYPKFESKPNLIELCIKLILSEAFVMSLDPDSINDDFLTLLMYYSKVNIEYFSNAIESIPEHFSENLEIYYERIKSYNTMTICKKHLVELKENSNESKFKLALSSILNLRIIHINYPEALIFTSNQISFLSQIYKSLRNILTQPSHENYIISLKIIINVALLDLATKTPEKKSLASEQIALGVGNLLILFENGKIDYPTEIISEISPNLIGISFELLDITYDLDIPMNRLNLNAYIKFVNLHSCKEICEAFIDLLCLHFIISTPLKYQGYILVEDLVVSNITVLGFMHFLKKYMENPANEGLEIIHFKTFFDYLIDRKLMTKTEEFLIKRFFNNFN